MEKKSITLITLLLIVFSYIGCSKDESPVAPNTEQQEFSGSTIAKLDSAIDEVIIKNHIPGVIVGIWFPDEGTYITAKGVSNTVTNEPMIKENHFRIGSVTKTFVGTAVLQLVDEGKINLDSSLAYYLPQYPFPQADKITVRMLGKMQSGIISYNEVLEFWVPFVIQNYWETFSADSLVKIALTQDSLYYPGTGWNYSNTNLVLLGLICEKVTGTKINDLIINNICHQNNLTNTYWPLSEFLPEPYSHGYTRSYLNGQIIDATYNNPSWADAAGILISNIYDLKEWMSLLNSGSLYSSAMKQERMKWVESLPSNKTYGFALGYYSGWIGHSGELPGYNTVAMYFEPKDAIIIIHVNSDINDPAREVIKAITKILTPDNIPYE
jgi:D-alanyl-D-alanine carboxypeptidase